MNTVYFPGLGLEFVLNRVAFNLFGKDIYWYGIIIAFGFLLAAVYCYRVAAPRFGFDPEELLNLMIFAVPLSVIGARAYYVIFYPDLYRDAAGVFRWDWAVAIWDGGLAIYGAVIVGVLTGVVFCAVRRRSFWCLADTCCFGLLIGQIIGRWGNFMNVEAYGSVTAVPWRMSAESIAAELLAKGEVTAEGAQQIIEGALGVHPTFLYESLWNLLGLILLILLARRGRRFDGALFLGYVFWYGAGRAVIEGLRTDSLYFFSTGLRVSQVVGILSALAAAILFVIRLRTAAAPTPPLAGKTERDTDKA